ncbi:MAG TPA: glycosyltransferase family 1 protein [Solirubrobacteraceae bacterium]|nr:glycosyltransferase family 1 protein [Solirubrobacteraceae bacterium]
MSESASLKEARELRVAVDARPLDIPFLRAQGIGRFAHALITELGPVAEERGGELVLLRARGGVGSPYGGTDEPDEGIDAISERRLRRPPVPRRLADFPEQFLLPLDVRRSGADLLHSLSIYRAVVAPGVPSVMTVHDLIPLMWPDQYLRTGLAHRMLYRAARRATRLIAVSEATRRDVIAELGVPAERIDVVHEAADKRFVAVDPTATLERLGIERPYVLYIGGLENVDPRKDVAGLIDAFAEWAHQRDRPETLVLAGGLGRAGAPLRERAERSSARIHFPGFVEDDDLPALYSGASCFVSATRYEGFGLPMLEAIACGTPVAAYDVGSLAEVCAPGALLLADVGNGSELMRAAERLCDEPELRSRLAAGGCEHATRFSWRRAAEQTWDVYERAAGTLGA